MCWEDEEESKDGEGEVCVCERERLRMRVGLRWRMFGWHCMCIFGVEQKMGMRVEAKVSDSEAR